MFLHVRKTAQPHFRACVESFHDQRPQLQRRRLPQRSPLGLRTVTDKLAGRETSAGRGTKRTTKKEHDEDDAGQGKDGDSEGDTTAESKEVQSAAATSGCTSCSNTVQRNCSLLYYTLISAVEKDRERPEWMWANTEHMLGDLKKHAKTMSDFLDMNTRLFLIGKPNDDLAKRVGNGALETTIKDGCKRVGLCRRST